ncbi:hypothetical protein [Belliella baltica]|uniref:hypothetical protein n=1 Tax=Belliella baltica TaxID=232259 RepID=UPI0002E63198|nr:hypothetical protein [Belliella baltica]
MNKSINRRNWIKSSLLGLGALTVSPAMALSKREVLHAYQPESTLKEYIPNFNYDEARITARLSANENPYGPAPKVIQAISEAVSSGNRYGHRDAATLMEMIAEKEGVSPEHIMLGPGSSDLLEKTAFDSFFSSGIDLFSFCGGIPWRRYSCLGCIV